MKIITSISITLLTLSSAFAQKLNQNYYYKKIDSLQVFAPIGNISSSDNFTIKPNASLTADFVSKFKGSFTEAAPFKTSFIESEALMDLVNQRYFVNMMERVEKLDSKTLSEVKIGDKLKQILASQPGRFFSFTFYSGLDVDQQLQSLNQQNGNENAEELYLPLATERPFLKNYFIVIDKKTEKVVYFHQNEISSSPTDKETIDKQLETILSGM